MKRLLFTTTVLLGLLAVARVPAQSSTAARQPLLATRDSQSAARLFYVDPVSLQPVAGRSLRLGFHWGDFVRSPDVSLLALSRNDAAELRFVRLPGLRFAGAMRFARGQFVRLVSWPSPHLLFALLDRRVLAIDPIARTVRWQRSIAGSVVDIRPAAGGVVVLAAPASGIGPATVTVVAADGSQRSVVLERVLAGLGREHSLQDSTARARTPGIAVDPRHRRAYVVGAGEPIAELELASLHVSYHGSSATLAKAVSGPSRQATWLGNGMLAVSGYDERIITDAQGKLQRRTTPSGPVLIDTRTWTSRSLQPDADATIKVGAALLAYRSASGSATVARSGSGLTIYSLDGTRRSHLLGRAVIFWTQAQGGLAYAWMTNRNGLADHVVVIDPGSGHILVGETRSLALLTGS